MSRSPAAISSASSSGRSPDNDDRASRERAVSILLRRTSFRPLAIPLRIAPLQESVQLRVGFVGCSLRRLQASSPHPFGLSRESFCHFHDEPRYLNPVEFQANFSGIVATKLACRSSSPCSELTAQFVDRRVHGTLNRTESRSDLFEAGGCVGSLIHREVGIEEFIVTFGQHQDSNTLMLSQLGGSLGRKRPSS